MRLDPQSLELLADPDAAFWDRVSLRHRPCTLKVAKPFCERVHRRLPKLQGALWAVAVWGGG